MTPQALLPAVLVPLIGYRLYRRFRTSFGEQPIQMGRMLTRMTLLGVIGTLMVFFGAHDMDIVAAEMSGLAIGAAIGFIGLRLTSFATRPDGAVFYTPNAYIGVGLTALLIGRIVYRFFVLNPTFPTTAVHAAGAQANPWGAYAYQSSPLTLAVFMLLVGYYLTYYTGILLNARKTIPAQ